MTCGIAYRKEYGAISFTSQVKRLGAPRPPVHWVVCMLEKVGALLQCEPVGLVRAMTALSRH